MKRKPDPESNRLDEAARAGWLYYIAGNTQDEVAAKLGVSRQTAQRLVSLSVSADSLERQAGLPDAADAGQRDQRRFPQRGGDSTNLLLTSNEAGRAPGQSWSRTAARRADDLARRSLVNAPAHTRHPNRRS